MDENDIDNVIRSIASGSSVNWETVDNTPADASIREVLRELRVIAQIANIHSTDSLAPPELDPSGTDQSETWGPLTLLERIGQGAFANVYRAHETRLDREVALKLLPAGPDDRRASSMIHEARLLARLTHPNVATVFGAEQLDGHVGIWMEFVRGTDLEGLLRAQGPLGPEQVSDIGLQLCDALAAVHRAGVLHRDIKATNVRRTNEGRIVLLDFGSGQELLAATSSMGLVGTPLYLAPELLEGSAATAQSDIYSVGVLLYHLLSGSYPVRGKTLADLRQAHAARQVTRLHEARPSSPRRLVAVIERAMHSVPSLRFATADEMRSALQSARAFPRRVAMMASVVTISAATAFAFWLLVSARGPFARDSAQSPALALTGRQLNFPINWSQMGAPSADGRLLSYADGNTGNLALMDLRTGRTQLVTQGGWDGEGFARYSMFSPDSRRVAYSWHARDCRCAEIRILDLTTGTPQVLLREETIDDAALLAWSHDGQLLLATIHEKNTPARLELVSIGHATRRALNTIAPAAAAFSPDDRFVVYELAASPRQPRDVHVIEVASLRDHPLISGPADEGDPFWIDDRVLYTSNRGNQRSLWGVRVVDGRAATEPVLVTDLVEPGFWRIGMTGAGSLFYGAPEGGSHVYTADLDRRGGDVSVPTRVTTATDPELAPEWSPDGRTLVWVSRPRVDGTRAATLRLHDLATRRERDVSTSFAIGQNPRWSPLGTTMLVRGMDAQGGALRLIDIQTGTLLGTFLQGRMFGDTEWTPDGSGVFYMDFGQNLIGRLPMPTGTDRVVYRLPKGQTLGRGIALSPDGESIAAHVFEQGISSIISIPVAGGPPTILLSLRPPDQMLVQEWTRDGQHVLFVKSRQIPGAVAAQEWQLWSIDTKGGEPRYLNLSMPDLGAIRPSPDGRRLVFTSSDSRNRIRVLDNVRTALRSVR